MSKKLSFENTKRLLEQSKKVDERIRDLIFQGVCETTKEANHLVNKAVYDMAEKNGISVWDVCFHFVPEYKYRPPIFLEQAPETNIVNEEWYIDLVPIELEFEKGPGYWKGKYYRLKEKMQELIDDKNDGFNESTSHD